MEKRLLIAKELLSEEGVIFISIDDNEQAQLKLLCDSVFGEDNFITNISVENNLKGRKNSAFIFGTNEYCIIYFCKLYYTSFYFLSHYFLLSVALIL